MTRSEQDQLNILVVDDDPGARSLLSEIIVREGHQAVQAESAEEILKLLPFWTFQIAFIDHNLPGMEGLMLGEYLTRNNPDMSVVLVTGMEDETLVRKTDEAGILLLAKPFSLTQILEVIDVYYGAAEEREQKRRTQVDDDYAPPLATYVDSLTERFDVPNVSERASGRVLEVIRTALNSLRSNQRYNERDRVTALAGLITARVLGLSLPKASSGRNLYEEYDHLMLLHGRREEFMDRSRQSSV